MVEFRELLDILQVKVRNKDFIDMWQSMDQDQDGELKWVQFVDLVTQHMLVETNDLEDLQGEMLEDATNFIKERGMPLAILGTNFCEVWAERHKVIMVFKLQALLKDQGIDRKSLESAFDSFDKDENGTL
eukprot:gene28766-35708_t